MDRWFEGKVALVTGGGSGIGRSVAIGYARRGAKVIIGDLNADAAAETASLIASDSGEALPCVVDVTDSASLSDLVAFARRSYGGLSIACNSAGTSLEMPLDDWDSEVIDRVFNLNCRGVMLSMKYEIGEMLRTGRGGAIVNIASVEGLVAQPAAPGYAGSKHAVVGMTKSAALQYVKRGIRVNAVCPGVTRTPLVERTMEVPVWRDMMLAMCPAGRFAEPEEIANAVTWLSSDLASYVTGHPLVVDGGFVAQ